MSDPQMIVLTLFLIVFSLLLIMMALSAFSMLLSFLIFIPVKLYKKVYGNKKVAALYRQYGQQASIKAFNRANINR